MTLKHKFKNTIVETDGIKFRSKRERNHYIENKEEVKKGKLLFFLMQVPFRLPGNTKYVLDFLEFWANGDILFVDTKGYRTPLYIMKKKQVEALYPIKITEK